MENKNEEYKLTIRDYIEMINSLPQWAYEELIDKFKAGQIKNEKTVRALQILGA